MIKIYFYNIRKGFPDRVKELRIEKQKKKFKVPVAVKMIEVEKINESEDLPLIVNRDSIEI